ncbi:SIR2 family protein [uncultured Herbaspirillum sp.]|uniref:SIR2 family protein n=1 Tax=uncultured Herbaspirillum sp. TaxID=160236 RepID=UPI00258DB50F|nr:SIR2 family protein [uncultured Herbaspirillum sp.]
MRFHENGPNIPDELIAAQRKGEVVFFCGAGVSVPARLPDFKKLARAVMTNLGVSNVSNAALGKQLSEINVAIEEGKTLSFSLDQTFYLLQQEYGKTSVAEEVLKEVEVPKGMVMEGHQSILRLSTSREGNPQVVTTNFDLLFDYADSNVKSFVPPTLPSLANGDEIDGVVYLHGKWAKTKANPKATRNLIISSADFGRAYLADGWASIFIKELAKQYVIVLVGYSADDPPVKYLLEGLHVKGSSTKARIYSFERGKPEDVSHNWFHRGVTGIAYGDHPSLWQSLKEWAQYAEAPQEWQRGVIEMAKQPPATLKPYERGQVAFTIGTVEGAKLFADASPPPPAEWLCVFDSSIRNRGPSRHGPLLGSEEFSSQERYSLNDEVYPTRDSAEDVVQGHDYLSEPLTDERRPTRLNFTNVRAELPARLLHLARWFAGIMHQPVALWWIAGQPSIAPRLKLLIEIQLRRADKERFPHLDDWLELIGRQEAEPFPGDFRLYRFKEMVDAQGWSARMLRSFEDALLPLVKVSRNGDVPPQEQGDKPTRTKVQLPHMANSEILVPDEYLSDAVKVYRSCIERYVTLTQDKRYSFIPDFLDDSTRDYKPELFSYIKWFTTLYSRLAAASPEKALVETNAWTLRDEHFFSPLRIHAWRQSRVFSPTQIMEGVCQLPTKYFWTNRKYIISLVARHWERLTPAQHSSFQAFLRGGPGSDFGFAPEQAHYTEIVFSAPFLMALEAESCTLDEHSQELIQRAKSHPDWEEPSERNSSRIPRVMRGTSNTEPDRLLTVPIAEVLSTAAEIEKSSQNPLTRLDPFNGLVKVKGVRSYRALAHAASMDEYPIEYWRDQFDRIPEGSSKRLYLCMVERALRMPDDVFKDLSIPITSFLERVLPALFSNDSDRGAFIWDRVFERLLLATENIEEDEENAQYGVRGNLLNSALGQHLQLLLKLYPTEFIKKDRRQKRELMNRLQHVFAASPDSRKMLINHGIAHLLWFYHHFPKWTMSDLVPRLLSTDEDYEHAWNGFMFLGYTMPPRIFATVKQDFINVFNRQTKWPWGKNLSSALHGHFLHYCSGKGRDGKYLTAAEARQVLQLTDENGRVNVLHRLREGGGWKDFQRGFLTNIWPREIKYRNPRVTAALIRIVFENHEHFAEAVRTVVPFMTHVSHADPDFYSHSTNIVQLAEKHPAEMLELVNAAVQEETIGTSTLIQSLLDGIEKGASQLKNSAEMRRLREFLDHHPY